MKTETETTIMMKKMTKGELILCSSKIPGENPCLICINFSKCEKLRELGIKKN